MSSIDWSAFTWEAFATLVTGLAAVCGATAIGFRQIRTQTEIANGQADIARRQSDIMGRQTEIMGFQAEVERATLRASIFDRRLLVHKSISDFIRVIFQCRFDDSAIFSQTVENLLIATEM